VSTTSEYAIYADDPEIRRRAEENARQFVHHETQFQLGHLPTEQPHPYTERFSSVVQQDTAAGIALLLNVDADIPPVARRVFLSPEYGSLVSAVGRAATTDRKICFSGCGSTGRLAMMLEEMWRQYWEDKAGVGPGDAARGTDGTHPALRKAEQAASVMTGGDRALIRSVESFEDHAAYGRRQIADLGLQRGDILVAITEGGETSSVIGTVEEGLERGCEVFLVYNNPTAVLVGSIERSRQVIEDPRVTVLDLYTGSMALTGSTRMQATTVEMVVVGSALEEVFRTVDGEAVSTGDRLEQANRFARLLGELSEIDNRQTMAALAERESQIYEGGGRVTYLASRFLLDVFSDTTERSPTFMLPPFRPADDESAPVSWAYAKDPLRSSPDAWFAMLRRAPRGIDWTADDYRRMGTWETLGAAPPSLGADEIARYLIGNEPDPTRTAVTPHLFLSIAVGEDGAHAEAPDGSGIAGGAKEPRNPHPADLLRIGAAGGDERRRGATGAGYTVSVRVPESPVLLWHHVATKLVMNTISTASMGIMNRIRGNWMVQLDPTNKKLIDRGSRIIAHIRGIGYPEACEELYRSLLARERLRAEGGHSTTSPVVDALDRLGG